jgi:hypothetical protein
MIFILGISDWVMYQICGKSEIQLEETDNSATEIAMYKESALFKIACMSILTVVKREHSWCLSFSLKVTFSGSHINTSIAFSC